MFTLVGVCCNLSSVDRKESSCTFFYENNRGTSDLLFYATSDLQLQEREIVEISRKARTDNWYVWSNGYGNMWFSTDHLSIWTTRGCLQQSFVWRFRLVQNVSSWVQSRFLDIIFKYLERKFCTSCLMHEHTTFTSFIVEPMNYIISP